MREQEWSITQQSASDGSRRKRASLGLVIVCLAIAVLFWCIVWLIPETQLARSGVTAQGTVTDVNSGGCGRHGSGEPITVQFTDQAGQVDTSTFSQCDFGTSVNLGESITIVYLPDNPAVIAPRDALPGTYEVHAIIIGAISLVDLVLFSIWIVRRIKKQRQARSASLLTQ